MPRVLMDSSALIAYIADEPGADRLGDLMDMIRGGSAQLVVSVLVLAEVYKRSDAKDASERHRYNEKLDDILMRLESRSVVLLDVTPPVAKKATDFRLSHKMKVPDAVHLATALLNRCDWLVSFDRDFPDIAGLRTFRMDRFDAKSRLPWNLGTQTSATSVIDESGKLLELTNPSI